MAHNAAQQTSQPPVPPPPSDEENPALADIDVTFKITMISAVLFCLAGLIILLRTRMG